MPAATIETTSADFGVLSKQVRDAGLLDRRFGYYGIMIPLTIAAMVVGFAALVLIGSSWWALGIAAFLGLAFTQLGFVGHDAGHHGGLSLTTVEPVPRACRRQRADRDELRLVGAQAQRAPCASQRSGT